MRIPRTLFAVVCFLGFIATSTSISAPVGTAFLFQGQLDIDQNPGNLPVDMRFELFSAETGSVALATVTMEDIDVNEGAFSVPLDFGLSPFTSDTQYWLQIGVRDGASTQSYVTLTPRQRIAVAPYAINARTVPAGAVDSVAIASGAVTSVAIADGAITADKIAPGAIQGSHLATGAVTQGKIGVAAILNHHLAQDAVTSTHILDGSIGSVELASGAVTAEKIADNAINTSHLVNGSIGTAQIADNAVTTAKIANASVTSSDIADGSITASKLAFSAGDVEGVIAGNGLSGGGTSGTVTLAVDFATTQARISGSCTNGQFISSVNSDGSVVCVTHRGGTQWTILDDSNAGQYAAIAIGSDGFPVIAYYDDSALNLMLAHCIDAGCSNAPEIHTLDSGGDVGSDASIAIGTDGMAIIAYRSNTAQSLKTYKCLNLSCSSGTTTTLDNSADVGRYSDIVVPADGQPIISYYDATNGNVRIARCATASCFGSAPIIASPVDNANDVGQFTSIALQSNGRALIAYYDATAQDLLAINCLNSTCSSVSTPSNLDSAGNVGRYASLTMDGSGLPIIAYRDLTNQRLKVARCTVSDCTASPTLSVLDDTSNTGVYVSATTDTAGVPFVAYQDSSDNNLRVALCNDMDCAESTRTTLDSAGNVGTYTSVAIGSTGLPIIAYRDATNGDLKVVSCGTRACL